MSRWHRDNPEAALAELLASPTGFPPGTRHLPAPPKPDVEPEQAPSATEEPARKHRR